MDTSVGWMLAVFLAVCTLDNVAGTITDHSGDQISAEDGEVEFWCDIPDDNPLVEWRHNDNSVWDTVDEDTVAGYEASVSGTRYTLKITSVNVDDKGIVQCSVFKGDQENMELTVVKCENPQLVPTSLVDDGSDTVDVEITCTYSYAGPYVPSSGISLSMKAGPEGNLRSIIDIDAPEDGAETATFNGKITFKPSSEDNGKDLICQYEDNPSFSHETTLVLDIKFSPRNMMTHPEADNGIVTPANSSVTCSADGNPPPTYVWTSSDDYRTSGRVLDLTDPDLNNNINGRMFVCTASNFFASDGYDSSLNITLSGDGGSSPSSKKQTNVAAIVAPIVVVAVIIIIVVVIFIIYKKRKGADGSPEKYPPSQPAGGSDYATRETPSYTVPVHRNPDPTPHVNPGYMDGSDPMIHAAGRESPAGHGSLGPPQLTPQMYKRPENVNGISQNSLNGSFV